MHGHGSIRLEVGHRPVGTPVGVFRHQLREILRPLYETVDVDPLIVITAGYRRLFSAGCDGVGQGAARLAAAAGAHHGPEQRVVGVAAAIALHRGADVGGYLGDVAHQRLDVPVFEPGSCG